MVLYGGLHLEIAVPSAIACAFADANFTSLPLLTDWSARRNDPQPYWDAMRAAPERYAQYHPLKLSSFVTSMTVMRMRDFTRERFFRSSRSQRCIKWASRCTQGDSEYTEAVVIPSGSSRGLYRQLPGQETSSVRRRRKLMQRKHASAPRTAGRSASPVKKALRKRRIGAMDRTRRRNSDFDATPLTAYSRRGR